MHRKSGNYLTNRLTRLICPPFRAIHTLQKNRTELKVLAGPPEAPNLHSLNGDVVTPLFHHLGTSSWHSYDGAVIVSLGKPKIQLRILFVGIILGVIIAVAVASRLQRRNMSRVLLGSRVLRSSRMRRKSRSDVLTSRIV